MNLFLKTIGQLFVGSDVKKGRVKGNSYNYSISFEDTKLPWKKTNSVFKKSHDFNSGSNSYIENDEFFISTEYEKISQALLVVKIIDVNKYVAGVVANMNKEDMTEEKKNNVVKQLLDLEALGKASILLQKHTLEKSGTEDLAKALEEGMHGFLGFFTPREFISNKKIETYSKNFYGIQVWGKNERGVEGDQHFFDFFVPIGTKIIHIMSIVTSENLKNDMKEEIEQIAHSLRFEMNEAKFLINALLDLDEKATS